MKVVLLPFADRRLREIIRYTRIHHGPEHALRLTERIRRRLLDLEQWPGAGAVEELLATDEHVYRRLVEGHHKIIYRIEGEYVLVVDIFDSRRDPNEMLGGQ